MVRRKDPSLFKHLSHFLNRDHRVRKRHVRSSCSSQRRSRLIKKMAKRYSQEKLLHLSLKSSSKIETNATVERSWLNNKASLTMELRMSNLLMLILLQGEISSIFSIPDDENSAVISTSEDTVEELPVLSHPVKAYLPPCDDNDIVRRKKSLRKRALGRPVNIPAEAVESMANTPISALSCQLPAIQEEIIDVHNKYRRLAAPSASNMLKMVWNSEASKTAGDWARQCQSGHSPQKTRVITNFKCGENVFLSNFKVPWNTVIDSWHSEVVDYKYGYGALSNVEIGHYTQMMWATSYAIGCEVNECATGPNKYVYVCHQCPAGNKGSRLFPWKEGKTCGYCPNSCDNSLCTNACPYEDNYQNCPDLRSSCTSDTSMTGSCPSTCQCTQGEIY